MKNSNKLDQLTSLRFFAAFMIVIYHCDGFFGFTVEKLHHLPQGVSLFFVLSGFILTYVYSRLETVSDIKNFWRARIARIWPAYMASLILGFILLGFPWETKRVIANLFMIQAWCPMISYYFSYNSVAWSISTEFFFYLAFPVLIYKLNQNWKIKLFGAGLFLLFLIFLSHYFQVTQDFNASISKFVITQHWLIAVNPTSRIFEFVFGMVLGNLWLRKKLSLSVKWATVLEIAAILICGLSIYFSNYLMRMGLQLHLGRAGGMWMANSGSFWAFGLLIYLLAIGKGKVSKLMATPTLVLLGELSFSMYLIHQLLIRFYVTHSHFFSHISPLLALLGLMVVLFALSYCMWRYIEMPGRRLLLGTPKIHSTSDEKNLAISNG